MSDTKFLLTMDFTTQGKIRGSSTKKQGGSGYSTGLVCHGWNKGLCRTSMLVQANSRAGARTARLRSSERLTRHRLFSGRPCAQMKVSKRLRFRLPGLALPEDLLWLRQSY